MEGQLHPKFRRIGDVVESRPANELSKLGISKKLETYAYYNARKGQDPNEVEDYLRKMSYYDAEGTIVEEECLFEYDTMTIIGEFSVSINTINCF